MPQTFMKTVPRANKIRFRMHTGVVEAPLMDNVSFTVGSQYSAPFDSDLVSGNLSRAVLATGHAPKVGISTTKYYVSPEPAEVTFDLEFKAFYDAREEVFIPVARLVIAALGIETTYEEMKAELAKVVGWIEVNTGFSVGASNDDVEGSNNTGLDSTTVEELEDSASDITEFVSVLRAPPRTSVINVGNIYTLESVYISSVSPQFSNVVDSRGYPMSATVSVTAVFERSPTANSMARAFSLGKLGTGELSSAFPPEQ